MALHNCQKKDDDFFAAQIIFFYTPKTTTAIQEQIAIYYHNPGFKSGDTISLTVQNVVRNINSTNYYYPTSGHGIILTRIAPTQVTYNKESIYEQQCLGYSADWVRNGTTMKTSCLSTHPDWMYKQRSIIRNHKVKSAFIPGFEEETDHLNFIRYLEKKFSGYLYPRVSKLWEVSFREIWISGKRILVSYDNNIYRKSSKMWPRIPQMWGDIRPSAGLIALQSHLTIFDANLVFPQVSMPQFTLDAITIASHAIADTFGMESTSLRRLAAIVGHNVTQWYNEIYFRNTNFVAVDYMD
ncbi:hypothetical protein PV327_003410, partial [Microctonus hyperodae]